MTTASTSYRNSQPLGSGFRTALIAAVIIVAAVVATVAITSLGEAELTNNPSIYLTEGDVARLTERAQYFQESDSTATNTDRWGWQGHGVVPPERATRTPGPYGLLEPGGNSTSVFAD